MSDRELELRAAAKVNLYLEVNGRRPDGYHDIRSLVVRIALFDRLVLEPTAGPIETVGGGPGMPDSDQNLATRAARLMQSRLGRREGVRIRIEKDIPVGGGLGGGSADAAAVLKGLNLLWGANVATDQLAAWGMELGADVPSLIHGGAVCMEGRGERVTPVAADPGTLDKPWWFLLANPGFGVSTRDIYARHKVRLTSPGAALSIAVRAWKEGAVERAAGSLYNGLQATAFAKYPLLELIAGSLARAGALGVLLSGTGASLFAVARDEDHARRLDACVRERMGCPLWTRVVSAPRVPVD